MSLLSFLHRPLDLDKPVNKGTLTADEPLRADRFLHYYLVEALSEHQASGVAVHVHEDDGFARAHLWVATEGRYGTWYEELPIPIETGFRLVCLVRARTRRRRYQNGKMLGVIKCRWQGVVREFFVESPHEWEVRIYFGPERPRRLSYTLVPTGRIRMDDTAAANSDT